MKIKKYLDFMLPIGLSTLAIISMFFIFLIYWGLGNGHIKYIYAAVTVILITYLIMFYATTKFSRKNRVILFLIIGFAAFIFSLLTLLGDVIGYKSSLLFYDIAEFLAVIFVLSIGFIVGNLMLMIKESISDGRKSLSLKKAK